MKKILLSLAAILLLAGGASAQTAKSAAVYPGKLDVTTVSVVKKANAPMMKEGESKYEFLGYEPTENTVGIWGPWDWDSASEVVSFITNGNLVDFSDFKGYKIVGLQFALIASLENPNILCFVYDDEETVGTQLLGALSEDDYQVSTIENNRLNVKYNTVGYPSDYTITGDEYAFMYGFYYEPVKGDGQSYDQTPFILGQTTDKTNINDLFYCGGVPQSGYEEGLYSLNDPTAKTAAFPLMGLILEKPNGATVILGVDGSVKSTAEQYFSLDGKKLSAPQKGINVVKMSDGTSKKVLVK